MLALEGVVSWGHVEEGQGAEGAAQSHQGHGGFCCGGLRLQGLAGEDLDTSTDLQGLQRY